MSNSIKSSADEELPHYLRPLLEPRPSGEAKLLAAWDGLSTEHQILLLTRGSNGQLRLRLTTKILGKALASSNAYVRYLAAKELWAHDSDSDEMALKKRIEDDPEPLVRYALIETSCHIQWPYTPEAFFDLPHEARLAIVRSLDRHTMEVAEVIHYAITNELPSGRVTEDELADLLLDYLTNPDFKSYCAPGSYTMMYDGWAVCRHGSGIEQLWMLVPDVPERIAYVLIKNLPEGSTVSSGIPDKVLNAMTHGQLQDLLRRPDIGLEGFRKKVFLDAMRAEGETRDQTDQLYPCAMSHNFELTNDEFGEILAQDEMKKAVILDDLVQYASDLSLCILQAVRDVRETEWSKGIEDFVDLRETAGDRFSQRLAQLKDGCREWEADDWRLYSCAKRAVPWKKSEGGNLPVDEFAFLAKHLKEGDTWGTFMAFSQAWQANHWEVVIKNLEKVLRRRFPLTEEERSASDEEDSIDENEDDKASDDEDCAEAEKAPQETIPDIKKPFRKGDFDLFRLEIRLRVIELIRGLTLLAAVFTAVLAVYNFYRGVNSRAWFSVVASGLVWLSFKGMYGSYRTVLWQLHEIRRAMRE